VHPIVSGNKWYKLQFYIKAALGCNATTIASFGGPYSNHLVALAFAAAQNQLKSIGYVRSNEGEPITPTLQEAMRYGMEIKHLGRSQFQERKNEILSQQNKLATDVFYVDEGGYGILGAQGAATILDTIPLQYDYIVCAVGTGTMMAGILNSLPKNGPTILGIPVLKNEGTIEHEIKALLLHPDAPFTLLHSFHQGGYAKTTPAQIQFMNDFWISNQIPLDIVYTGKLMYAVTQLVEQGYFKVDSKILVIHSGGLQGNRSLEKGVLLY
jgi:1-aminocyclopropane-1-carboxylate deaminase